MDKDAGNAEFLNAKEYTDLLVRQEREAREAHQLSETQKFEVFLRRNDEHLERLNHEGERIKAILASSVTAEKFADYQESQRSKVEAKESSDREAFRIFSEQVALQFSTLSKQVNRWAGGLAVLLAGLELWLNYRRP